MSDSEGPMFEPKGVAGDSEAALGDSESGGDESGGVMGDSDRAMGESFLPVVEARLVALCRLCLLAVVE